MSYRKPHQTESCSLMVTVKSKLNFTLEHIMVAPKKAVNLNLQSGHPRPPEPKLSLQGNGSGHTVLIFVWSGQGLTLFESELGGEQVTN